MEAAYQDGTVTIFNGDCLDVLLDLPDASVDSIVTDPPYGLAFMGKRWDTGAVAFDTAIWGHCLRVLKPGGHLLAFGGTRTWHRLAAAIEDAGFEIRDNIAWLYGSGFPKSMDVSKAIDKSAGAKRQVIGTAENWGAAKASDGKQAYGDYEGNWSITAPATDDAKRWQGWGTALKPAFEPIVVARKPLSGTVAANVLTHGTGAINIDGCRVGVTGGGTNCPGGDECHCSTNKILGATKHPVRREGDFGRWPANIVLDEHAATELDQQNETASRYFPTFYYQSKAPKSERPIVDGVAHPTVKPLALMRWLIRLVTQPGGVVLDPFAGSGTTIEAALLENVNAIGVEMTEEYIPLILSRIDRAKGQLPVG